MGSVQLDVYTDITCFISWRQVKCSDVALHEGFNLSIWIGICGEITLGASPGQMRVILAGAAAGEEVIIHTFGAMDVGMLMLLGFLTCREHLFPDTIPILGIEMINMLVGWQVVRMVCLVYKIVHWPFYMFETGPLKSELCCFHQWYKILVFQVVM